MSADPLDRLDPANDPREGVWLHLNSRIRDRDGRWHVGLSVNSGRTDGYEARCGEVVSVADAVTAVGGPVTCARCQVFA